MGIPANLPTGVGKRAYLILAGIIFEDDEKHSSSLSLLKSHRELRQNQDINITFIYAGSIGFESIVKKIGDSKYINDLYSVTIPPLDFEDAKAFVKQLLSNNHFDMNKSQIEYLLHKIKWFIPFYIQLILPETKKLYKKNPNRSSRR
jgi:hypothetical protein